MKQRLAAISPSSFKGWALDFMPSYDRKTAFKIGGPKLGYTQKSHFVEISDYNDLYTVLISLFVWFLSYF